MPRTLDELKSSVKTMPIVDEGVDIYYYGQLYSDLLDLIDEVYERGAIDGLEGNYTPK